MTTCSVCGTDLPAQRGPRARRYCSRACQAKAYRTRQQQRDAHRPAPGEEDHLLAQHDGVPALKLADQLALATRRVAGALTAGQVVDDVDLGIVARIPVVLAARAQRAAPAGQAPRRPERHAAPNATVIDPAADAPAPGRDLPEAAVRPAAPGHPKTPDTSDARERVPGATAPTAADRTKASRDDSTVALKRIEPRPQKLARKRAVAIVDAAELVRDPDHRETHRWILRSGSTILGYVEPTYGGASRSGRTGWTGRLSGSTGRRCTTRDQAAADLAQRWMRLVTTAPSRTLTGN
jgi:hypothetical protein